MNFFKNYRENRAYIDKKNLLFYLLFYLLLS